MTIYNRLIHASYKMLSTEKLQCPAIFTRKVFAILCEITAPEVHAFLDYAETSASRTHMPHGATHKGAVGCIDSTSFTAPCTSSTRCARRQRRTALVRAHCRRARSAAIWQRERCFVLSNILSRRSHLWRFLGNAVIRVLCHTSAAHELQTCYRSGRLQRTPDADPRGYNKAGENIFYA